MIILNNLSKTFFKDGNKIEVLRGLNLEIAKGESLAILGVSGAGKSTLIHILGTLDHPTEGYLHINGLNVFDWEENKMAAFRNSIIGFIFQFNNLLPEFDALENTMMPALISGMSRRQAVQKAHTLLKEVGLEQRLKHKPGELSGGEIQRVTIARAVVGNPEVILADEPTADLDQATGWEIIQILKMINDAGKTVIIATHNFDIVNSMKKRVILLDRGKVVKDGVGERVKI